MDHKSALFVWDVSQKVTIQRCLQGLFYVANLHEVAEGVALLHVHEAKQGLATA